MKGLFVFVLRGVDGYDCTNGGVTTKYQQFVLIGKDIPEIFTPDKDAPALYLIERMIGGRQYFHASTTPGSSGMAGGNFVYTSDSRFPNRYPISVHDRFETKGAF